MLFWLFVIIFGVCLVSAFFIFSADTEYDRLEAEYQSARDLYWSADFSTSISRHKQLSKAYDEADKTFNDYKKSKKYSLNQLRNRIAGVLFGIGCVALGVIFVMLLIIGISHGCAGGEKARLEAEYEVLSWEVENRIYDDNGDDVVGKKELYKEVREWNAELASNQYYEKNFWLDPFVPDIYGDLKPIELK